MIPSYCARFSGTRRNNQGTIKERPKEVGLADEEAIIFRLYVSECRDRNCRDVDAALLTIDRNFTRETMHPAPDSLAGASGAKLYLALWTAKEHSMHVGSVSSVPMKINIHPDNFSY